ncbi:hypothetical protein JCM9279_000262 [Rhodotorula babjevae]
MAPSAYDPARRSRLSRYIKVFRDPLRAMRAPMDRRDLPALEIHWREVERGEGTTAGYSEPDRRAALQHAVPPLASCWVSVHAPRQATQEAVRALCASVQREVERLERDVKKLKYLRVRLRRFAANPVGVPLDRERYGNEGPAWARG